MWRPERRERTACKVKHWKRRTKRRMRERGEKMNIEKNADGQREIGFY